MPTSIPKTLKRRWHYFQLFPVGENNAEKAGCNCPRSHKWPRQDLNPGLSELKAQVLSVISRYLSLQDIGLSLPNSLWARKQAREEKRFAPGFVFTAVYNLEKDGVHGRKTAASVDTASWPVVLAPSMSTGGKMSTRLPCPAQQMALLALIHWGTGLGGENMLFIMLAQPHYVYGCGEPHIKISVCANDHTMPSGLLGPLNRPIFQLWSDDQSVFFYNPIIFLLLTVQTDFFSSSWWSQAHQQETAVESREGK